MSMQHCRMLQVERFFRQCRMLLRHCCWRGRGFSSQQLDQYAGSRGNRAYCYAERAVSSVAVAESITSTHCTGTH